MPEAPPEHPLIKQLRAETADRPSPSLTGFMGDSGQAGVQRLYFSPRLDSYAEFADGDVASYDDVPAEALGVAHETPGTRVTLKPGARVDVTRIVTTSVAADKASDVDLRLGDTHPYAAVPPSYHYTCPDRTMYPPPHPWWPIYTSVIRTMCTPVYLSPGCPPR